MPISIGNKPENDFTNPLGMLSDCHRRIEKFLRLLNTVTEQAQGAALNDEQREALQKALDYFQRSAPNHTLDEEESVFPRMLASESAAVTDALAKLEPLHEEHLIAEKLHAEVETLGQAWLDEGRLEPERLHRLSQLLKDLQTIYQRHITVEDTEIFPLAGNLLNARELALIGSEMAARRGIDIQKWQKLL
ncbi:MAG: hemerythrin domain-containing protein [Acidobacteriota bacterium]